MSLQAEARMLVCCETNRQPRRIDVWVAEYPARIRRIEATWQTANDASLNDPRKLARYEPMVSSMEAA